MIGNNKLILNKGTIQKAIEFWLKQEIMKDTKFEVINIKATTTGMDAFGLFEIEIKEKDESE